MSIRNVSSPEIPACFPQAPGPQDLGCATPVVLSSCPQPDPVASPGSRIESYRANDAAQTRWGTALEGVVLSRLEAMSPGARAELLLGAEVSSRYAGELQLKALVERKKGGKYQVSIEGALGGGLGANGPLGAKASARLGTTGAVTFEFATAAQAADRLSALMQSGALVQHPTMGALAQLAGLVDANALSRSRATLEQVKSVELGLYGRLETELQAAVLEAGLELVGKRTLRVDLQAGRLIHEAELGGKGVAMLDFSVAKGEARSHALLRTELDLSRDDLLRIARGELGPDGLLSSGRARLSLVQAVSGRLGPARFEATREEPLASLRHLGQRVGSGPQLFSTPTANAGWELNAWLGLDGEGSAAPHPRQLPALSVTARAIYEQPLLSEVRLAGLEQLPAVVRSAAELHTRLQQQVHLHHALLSR